MEDNRWTITIDGMDVSIDQTYAKAPAIFKNVPSKTNSKKAEHIYHSIESCTDCMFIGLKRKDGAVIIIGKESDGSSENSFEIDGRYYEVLPRMSDGKPAIYSVYDPDFDRKPYYARYDEMRKKPNLTLDEMIGEIVPFENYVMIVGRIPLEFDLS